MVLRRTLPSRLTGAPPPEGMAQAASSATKPAAVPKTLQKETAPTAAPAVAQAPTAPEAVQPDPKIKAMQALVADAFAAAPAPAAAPQPAPAVAAEPLVNIPPAVTAPEAPMEAPAEPAPPPPPAAVPAPAVVAAADPTEAPRRLEDSFQGPAKLEEAPAPVSVSVSAPIPDTTPAETLPAATSATEAAAPAPTDTVADTDTAATESAATQSDALPTDFLADNPFLNAQGAENVAPTNPVVSTPPANPLRRRVPQSGGKERPQLPKREPQANRPTRQPDAAVPAQPEPTPTNVEPTAAAQAKASGVSPSRRAEFGAGEAPAAAQAPAQDKAPAKRARTVAPRDFAAATIVAAAPEKPREAPTELPQSGGRPAIPVDTRPLDRVDEELIASGILAGPQGDSLTRALPGGMAVTETHFGEEEPLSFGAGFTAAAPATGMAAGGSMPGGSAPAFGPMAPMPNLQTQPTSGGPALPWQAQPVTPMNSSGDGHWGTDSGPTPPPDIFAPGNLSAPAPQPTAAAPAAPRVIPAVLPTARGGKTAAGGSGASTLAMLATVGVIGGVGWFVWHQMQSPGGLERVSAQLAQLTQPTAPTLPTDSPETIAATDGRFEGLLPPPTAQGSTGGNTVVDFAPPQADPNAPIIGTATDDMPTDVSLFARLQQEIAAQRAARGEGVATGATTAPSGTVAGAEALTKEEAEAELAAMREVYASLKAGETPPKPNEILRSPDAYMDGSARAALAQKTADGELLPPPANTGATLPPPNELYTQNPNNLPIVAEPQPANMPRIRQLEDYAAELIPVEEPTVQIPKGVRPRLAATDAPNLDVLSFVPGRGIIATANGREGVLLIGEIFNGWELTNVTAEMAEFQAGNRKHYLTAQN